MPLSHHQTVPAKDIPYFLEKLCTEYNQSMLTRNVDPILSMINFIFHFICIVPFDKGNGRMVRLLFSLLLVKEIRCCEVYFLRCYHQAVGKYLL